METIFFFIRCLIWGLDGLILQTKTSTYNFKLRDFAIYLSIFIF